MSSRLEFVEICYIQKQFNKVNGYKNRSYSLVKNECAVLTLHTDNLLEDIIKNKLPKINDYIGNIKLIMPINKSDYPNYKRTVKDINRHLDIEKNMKALVAKNLIDDFFVDNVIYDAGITIYYETKLDKIYTHVDRRKYSATIKILKNFNE